MKINNLSFPLIVFGLLFLNSCGLLSDPKEPEDDGNVTNAIKIDNESSSGIHEWTNHTDGVDYILEGEVYFFDGSLTIEEGTTIVFGSSASLEINHNCYIIAEGTTSQPIVFTGEEKTEGFYQGLKILSNDVRNTLSNCIVEYGGSSGFAVSVQYYTQAATAAVNNCTIRNCSGDGIQLNSKSTLTSCTGNKFTNIVGFPIECSIKAVSAISSNNQFENNGFDGPSIIESRLSSETTSLQTLQKLDFHVQGEIDLDAGLAISPGSNLTFAPDASITVDSDGYFIAEGTPSQRIVFTGEISNQPSWNGICFEYETNDVRNSIKYCDILYAGFAPAGIFSSTKAGITLTSNSLAEISNCHIANSGGCGIYVSSGSFSGSEMTGGNNTFTNNNGADVCN